MAVRRYQGGGQVNTQQMQQEASDLANLGQPSATWIASHPQGSGSTTALPPDANAQGIQNASDAQIIQMIRASGNNAPITADQINMYRNNPSAIPGQFGQYYSVNEPTAQQRQEMTNLSQQESQAIMQGAQPQQQQQGPPQYSWNQLQALGQQQAQQGLNPQGGPNYAQFAASPWATGVQTQAPAAPTGPAGSMYNLQGSFATAPPQPVQQFQGGGPVYSNPLYSIGDLGAAALGQVFGTAYGTPVYNPMPNQQYAPGQSGQDIAGGYAGGGGGGGGQGGQGGQAPQFQGQQAGMTIGGVYTGPQYATFGTPAAVAQGGQWAPQGGIFTQMPGIFGKTMGQQTTGLSIPGYGTLDPNQSQQFASLYQAAQKGNPDAQAAMQSWQKGMGMSDQQLGGMMYHYNNAVQNAWNQPYPGGGAPSANPLTPTPWATGTGGQLAATPTATGTQAGAPQPFATAPMPGTVGLPGGAVATTQPPPAPGVPPMMGQGAFGQPGVARPTAFGGTYGGYTAGVPGGAAFQQGFEHGFTGLPKMPPVGGGAGGVAQAASTALATGGGAPAAPLKAQSGGYVRGYQGGDLVQDPEVPKAKLSVPQTGSSQGGQGSQGGQPAPYTGTVENDPYMSNAISRILGLQTNPWHPGISASASGGASGGGYNVPGGPGGYIGASAAPGQSGFWYPSQAAATAAGDVGTGMGGGLSQQQGNALAGGIQSIGAAFQQALNKTANTPWQWQSSKIPAPPPAQPPSQLAQEQMPQEQRGGTPNMASYAATQPYYQYAMSANV